MKYQRFLYVKGMHKFNLLYLVNHSLDKSIFQPECSIFRHPIIPKGSYVLKSKISKFKENSKGKS